MLFLNITSHNGVSFVNVSTQLQPKFLRVCVGFMFLETKNNESFKVVVFLTL